MQLSLNNFRYFYFLGSKYKFDKSWEQIDQDRYSLYNPYFDREVEKSGFGLFSNSDGDIVFAFNILNDGLVGPRAYDYRLFIDDESFVINNNYYSLQESVLNKDKSSPSGIFIFSKSEKVEYQTDNDSPVRCDYGTHGPVAFTGKSGPSKKSFDFKDSSDVSLGATRTARSLISVFDVGHIAYMEVVDDSIELEAISSREVPCITRTMGEQFKLISEWAYLCEPPFNSNEEISLLAKSFLEELRMTKDIKDDLAKNQADMQVARFLKGQANARNRPSLNQIKNLTKMQKRWVDSKFIFKGFEKMKSVLG
jgi:hypothetical protein